ncbi:hypothetical protein JTE90_016100 [Oedothorax gibbosus]|uniref:CCHC-type domain-containing protein n=1 Tax=Oedothorax gibbosus TaxID=931172 RepID=A0AAV6TRR3_9ARAC|nr:hypothetical protein JTE90_016100 [Oedothorax gibbosus]
MEDRESQGISETLDSLLGVEIGGSSQATHNRLATETSPFILNIKEIISNINKRIDNEANRKLNQKDRSELKELHINILLECMKAEANYLLAGAKISELENQLSNRDVTLEGIDKKLDLLVDSNKLNNIKILEVLDGLGDTDSITSNITKSKIKKDESPVLVIDTNEDVTAFSYRDALMKRAPDLDIPNPADLVIPRANRLIIKMKDSSNLEKFRDTIQNDPNLGKLANSKISKLRKVRLIAFGVPDSIKEQEFKQHLESLEETGGRPVEIIKAFKNGKKLTDTTNYIMDVDSKTADNLLILSKFVLHFNRVRIKRYFNILRCYRCQWFGHASHNCKYDVACAACAGRHETRQCTSNQQKCINCLQGKGGYKHDHRADDRACNEFLDYKANLLSRGNDD